AVPDGAPDGAPAAQGTLAGPGDAVCPRKAPHGRVALGDAHGAPDHGIDGEDADPQLAPFAPARRPAPAAPSRREAVGPSPLFSGLPRRARGARDGSAHESKERDRP